MINHLVHAAENNEESKSHMKQHEDKFQGDCKVVLQMLYSGKRLTARELEKYYDMDGRRLRDLHEALPGIVKREWRYDESGKKTKYKEYFIDQFSPPTKESTVEKALRYIKGQDGVGDYARRLINAAKENGLSQSNLFS